MHDPGSLCTSEGHLALFFFPCQTRRQRTFVAATRSDKVTFVNHSYCRFCIHELIQSEYVVNMVNFVRYKYTCVVVIVITIIILLLSSLSYYHHHHHHHHHHWSAAQRCFILLTIISPTLFTNSWARYIWRVKVHIFWKIDIISDCKIQRRKIPVLLLH